MKKPIDVTQETRVDWDKEIEGGHLVEVTPEDDSTVSEEHVQSVKQTSTTLQQRVIPSEVAHHVAQTRRYPIRSTTKYFF